MLELNSAVGDPPFFRFHRKSGMVGDFYANGHQVKILCKHPYPPYLNHTR